MGACPVLTILKGGETVRSVPLEGDAVLGRAEGCVIRLEDRAISRQHALFSRKGDQIQVEKKSEFAPLKVNGTDCTCAMLKDGDVVAIGPYLLKLSMQESAAEPSPPPPAPEPVTAAGEGAPQNGKAPHDDSGNASDNGAQAPQANGSPPVSDEVRFNFDKPGDDQSAGNPSDAGPMEVVPQTGFEEVAQENLSDPNLAAAAAAPAPSSEGGEPTKLVTDALPELRLILRNGAANFSSFVISKEEIFIGRGKDCDVIVGDKKASRKNSSIVKQGLFCTIKDLGSSNGTYVNEQKITEQELSSGDVIRIGDCEFELKAEKPGYSEQMKDFMEVPPQEESGESDEAPGTDGSPEPSEAPDLPAVAALLPGTGPDAPLPGASALALPDGNAAVGSDGAPSVAGILGVADSGGGKGKPKSLMEKYRALPKRTQYIVIVAVIMGGYWLLWDDEVPPPPKPKQAQTANKDPNSPVAKAFGALTKEQQDFVRTQHQLAFDQYKNKEYDAALFEIQKIFKYVDDYEDSREIERYAKEGKRKLEALAEEKLKKANEEATKARVSGLIAQAREKMDKKDYTGISELFSEILALDPENQQVAQWQAKMRDEEADKRVAAERQQVQEQINRQAWDMYHQGVELRKAGELRKAMIVFVKVKKIEAPDHHAAASASAQIKEIRQQIIDEYQPLLKEAKEAEDGGDFVKAFDDFRKALEIEPNLPDASKAIDRMTTILNDRAKILYTEAILAESYSDFATAKRKYQECMKTAPPDSPYHDRAERKLGRYFRQTADDGQTGTP